MSEDYFAYNVGSDIPKDAFRISPSQISRFFTNTTEWYREHLLGEDGFTGNTGSALGNCVHAAADSWVKEGAVCYDQIEYYIDGLTEEYDVPFIRSQYKGMIDTLLFDYLVLNPPDKSELFLSYEVLPGIYIGGTLDNLTGSCVKDYKTTSSKTAPTKMSRSYLWQQLVYVYLARKNGYKVDTIKLVFITTNDVDRYSEKTGKKLKDYPSQVSEVVHQVTDEDMQFIDNIINLVAHSVKTWEDKPELRYLLAQDFRMYTPPKRQLFKEA